MKASKQTHSAMKATLTHIQESREATEFQFQVRTRKHCEMNPGQKFAVSKNSGCFANRGAKTNLNDTQESIPNRDTLKKCLVLCKGLFAYRRGAEQSFE